MWRQGATFLALLLCNFCLAQEWSRVRDALDVEDFYRARFYLKEIPQGSLPASKKFRFNNLKIEASLLDRASPEDSVKKLMAESGSLRKSSEITESDHHWFEFLNAWSEQFLNNPNGAYSSLSNQNPRDPIIHAAVLYKKADIERNTLRNFAPARVNLQQAIRLYHRDSSRYYFKIYKCRLLLGLVFRDENDFVQAEKNYRLSLAILDKIPEPKFDERAKVLNNLGNLFRNDYSKAQSFYEESLQIRIRYVKDSSSLATAYTNLGAFYYNFGNYPKAKQCYSQSLIFSRNNALAYNQLIYNYSILLNEFYETSVSRDLIRKALKRSEPLFPNTNVWIIRLKLRLAQDELNLGHENEANRILQEVAVALRPFSSGDPLWINYYDVKALQMFRLENAVGMNTYSDSALFLFEKQKNRDAATYANLLKRKGDAQLQLNQWDETNTTYRRRQKLLLSYQPPTSPEVIQNYIGLGEVQFNMERYDSAIYFFQQALRLTSSDGKESAAHESDRFLSHAFLSRTYLALYDRNQKVESLEAAHNHVRQSIVVIQGRKNKLMSEMDKESFSANMFAVFPLAVDIAYQRYLLAPTAEHAEEFFECTELSKSQLLVKSIREQKINDFAGVTSSILHYESELDTKEEEVNRTLDALLARERPEPEIISSLKKDEQVLQDRKMKFLDSIRQHLPDYYNLKYNQTLVNLRQLQDFLRTRGSSTAVVAYGIGRENAYGVLVTSGKTIIKRLGNLDVMRKNVRVFRSHIRILTDDELWTASTTLYGDIFKTFEADLKNDKSISKLAFIPEDALVNLPFEALVTGNKANPSYLIERFETTYGYSATLFWQKNTDPIVSNAGQPGFMGFAPSFSEGPVPDKETVRDDNEQVSYTQFQFADLPGAKKEVESIQDAFEKKKMPTQIFIGDEATEMAFKKRLDGTQKYIHLATHGFTDGSSAWQAGVAFHQDVNDQEDGLLLTNEIYSLRLFSELVILSACETGLGKYLNGEGVIGLTRAFLYAGTRSVMVSLWKVEDSSTAVLMTRFYQRGILNQKSKAAALREAKLSMIRDGLHPFYWSSFILIGAE